MDDIAKELAKLHVLTGADFSRQVERIAKMNIFYPLADEKNIYITGGEQQNDFENLLNAARKAVDFGYQVFILPNPQGVRSADFILRYRNVYKLYDLKTVQGKSSVGTRLLESIGQCNRIILNTTVDYNTRLLTSDIKRYFEVNEQALEVLIFKGKKKISIVKRYTINPSFYSIFKRLYEK